MSIISTFTVMRAGVQISTGTMCQMDNISISVIAGAGGAIPWNSYELYTTGLPDIQHNDVLIDERNVEPTTGKPVQYRVSGNPETFDWHLETVITKFSEATP